MECSVRFEADGLPATEAAELMEGALATHCAALKKFTRDKVYRLLTRDARYNTIAPSQDRVMEALCQAGSRSA